MYNRKFNIKLDFGKLNEMENEVLPKIKDEQTKQYVRDIFFNQFKK
jgi:hypothetical protein